MTHPDPFTNNAAFEDIMSEIKADEAGGPEMTVGIEVIHPHIMTLRDDLAARAMCQLIARNEYHIARNEYRILPLAKVAYQYADAMLEARKAKT